MIPVELKPAYTWKCPSPHCRQVNFEQPLPFDPTDHDKVAEVRDTLGLQPWQDLPQDIEVVPLAVRCGRCGRLFETAVHARERPLR